VALIFWKIENESPELKEGTNRSEISQFRSNLLRNLENPNPNWTAGRKS
jgi:hypothetical protein